MKGGHKKQDKAGKDRPLQCKIEGDELVIRIGIDVIAFAAENTPETDVGSLHIRVCDKLQFAKDVCCELMSEEEDGSSPLSDVLDKTSIAAWENGSIGCHEEDESSKR